MKKYVNSLLAAVLLSFVAAVAVKAQSSRDFRPDHDYYDDEFDWRWDIRVRISDGINSGLITRWEANRLYNKLENIEEKEYVYAADGVYDSWEQDDIWQDVQWLHSRIGLELRDNDRVYYGFDRIGIAYYGYPSWWYSGGYNFYRFDRRGFGSVRIGYAPQCYVPRWVPSRTVYINNYRTYGHTYYRNNEPNRVVYYNRDDNRRSTTNAPRTSGRNSSTVYNRNDGSRSRGTMSTENNRSRGETYERPANRGAIGSGGSADNGGSVNRSGTRTREYSRPAATTERPAAVSRSYEGRSESLNRTNARTREYSQPTAPRRESYTPSRSEAGSSESFNNRSSSPARSTPNTTYERASSSRRSNAGTTEGRTKLSGERLPEARRSSSGRGN